MRMYHSWLYAMAVRTCCALQTRGSAYNIDRGACYAPHSTPRTHVLCTRVTAGVACAVPVLARRGLCRRGSTRTTIDLNRYSNIIPFDSNVVRQLGNVLTYTFVQLLRQRIVLEARCYTPQQQPQQMWRCLLGIGCLLTGSCTCVCGARARLHALE